MEAPLRKNWLEDAITEASLGRTRRHHRVWITGETVVLSEQAHLARTCAKPSGPEEANNDGTTKGSQRLLEGDYARD